MSYDLYTKDIQVKNLGRLGRGFLLIWAEAEAEVGLQDG
jgi:hypothetical protein